MKFFVVLFLSIIPLTSYATTCNDNCIETPTCESLGYFKDATCENEYITCPFDSSYKWCKQYTCSDGKYHDEHPVEAGWECREISYKGSSCLDCECKPLDTCKYNANNAGNGILLDPCCTGSYQSCWSNCPRSISYPDECEPIYSTCLSCGKTTKYVSDYKCE